MRTPSTIATTDCTMSVGAAFREAAVAVAVEGVRANTYYGKDVPVSYTADSCAVGHIDRVCYDLAPVKR